MNKIEVENLHSLERINADWIAIIPYAYTPVKTSKIIFYQNHPRWWGEGVEGVIGQIILAKQKGLKIMIKPQVWVLGEGWPGDFEPENEDEWKTWENEYSKYILTYAKIADSLNIDLFCISTEYRKVVQNRPGFWLPFIQEIKNLYKGSLTYAANWDNYQNVSFWSEMDYIGIDAYFPLSEDKTPSVNDLTLIWEEKINEIRKFSQKLNKKILFTEYGYRSCDYSTDKHWLFSEEHQVNVIGQSNAYEALYSSVWNKDWMAGGFLWKWYANDQRAGGLDDRHFTPQNKPVEAIIRKWYTLH